MREDTPDRGSHKDRVQAKLDEHFPSEGVQVVEEVQDDDTKCLFLRKDGVRLRISFSASSAERMERRFPQLDAAEELAMAAVDFVRRELESKQQR